MQARQVARFARALKGPSAHTCVPTGLSSFRIGAGRCRFSTASTRFGKAEAILKDSGEEVELKPQPRINESTETKRARLLWQSRKRGILETCVLLGKFAQEYLPTLTREELDDYDIFMNENDWDIYYWVTNAPDAPKPCPERWEKSSVMAKMRKIGRNENHEIMQQPNLY